MGVRPEKNLFPRKLRKTIPDSVVTFFPSISGPLLLWGRKRALRSCLLACAQAPPWCPNNLINRLKFYEFQLGDPNPSLGMPAPRFVITSADRLAPGAPIIHADRSACHLLGMTRWVLADGSRPRWWLAAGRRRAGRCQAGGCMHRVHASSVHHWLRMKRSAHETTRRSQ